MKKGQRIAQHLRVVYRSIREGMPHICKVFRNFPEVSYNGDRVQSLEPPTAASHSIETRQKVEAEISSMTNPLKPFATLWIPYHPRQKIFDSCRDGNRSAEDGNNTLIPTRAPTHTGSATSERRLVICGRLSIDVQYLL